MWELIWGKQKHNLREGENNLRVLCCTWYVVWCYAAAPPFGHPGTPPVRCCNLQCTIQGPLCVNENNGYNGLRRFFIGNKQKKMDEVNRRTEVTNKEEERRRNRKIIHQT